MRHMLLDPILARFSQGSPVTVMARAALERTLDETWVNGLFEAFRERQYTRELLFSTTVEVMSLVALGLQPSVHAAARAREDLQVSLAALYDKINGTETGLSRALVSGSAARLGPTAKELRAKQKPVLPGYEVRVIDGNHLPASEKRLAALRGFRGAALPGHSLVVYDPDARIVTDVVPCEDAHAQERTLVPAIFGSVKPGQAWIADRNFSTTFTLFGIDQRRGSFIIREHGSSPNPKELGTAKFRGAIEAGDLYEQMVQIENDAGEVLVLRRIELRLHTPTDDGETVIRILTNLPKSVSAAEVAQAYRGRWKIENMFQWLESVLHSEVRTLGQPRAALFAFAVATVAFNALSVVQSAIETAHGIEPEGDSALSLYFLVVEIKNTFGGMAILLPSESWLGVAQMAPSEVAAFLLDTARHVKTARYRKTTRGPKKITKRGYVPGKVARSHVATSRVLAAAKPSKRSP
jgi:IS4 transposase